MAHFRAAVLLASLTVLAGIACRSQASLGASDTELRTDYADLFRVLGPEDLERWGAARTKLQAGLDRACASAACGGFSTVASVQLTCSASVVRHAMHACAWTLGGSIDTVDGATGAHAGEVRAITCAIPFHTTSATALLDTLASAGDAALDAPLPGGGSFHDALDACLTVDAGVAPPSPAAPATPDFVALEDLLPAGSKDGDAWRGVQQALQRSFDDICGDTFCEGDYGDIRGLRLTCATERATGQVHACTWTFAMASSEVAGNGDVHATTATQTCTAAIDASAGALLAALRVDDPLYAPLPGRTTSLNDALIGCL